MLRLKCNYKGEREGGDGTVVYEASFIQLTEEAPSVEAATRARAPRAPTAASIVFDNLVTFTVTSTNEADLTMYTRGNVYVLQPAAQEEKA